MSRGKRSKRAPTDPSRHGGAEQPSPTPIRRPTVTLETLPALTLLLALVATLTLGLIWNEDLWWYLSTGEVVLDQGSIPDHDLLLYTSTEETHWPSHSWLFSVSLALILRLVGLSGVVIFGALIAAAIITLIFCSARVDRFGLVNALLTALVIVTAGGRLGLKAELVTWLLVVVFFYLLDRDAPFTWRTLLILCGLEWAWANLHAGYPLGSAMVFAYSVGGWLEGWWKRRKGRAASGQPDDYKPPPLWAAPVVLLASLLTPQAAERLHMLGIVTTITSSHLAGFELSQTVNELEPTFKAADSTYAMLYLLAVAVGRSPSMPADPFPGRCRGSASWPGWLSSAIPPSAT